MVGRYGVISDVHGNIFALRAAVQALAAKGVEAYLCAGDLVGYGPHPNECVDMVRELDAVCVAGNHDLFAVGMLSGANFVGLAEETQRWTQAVLRDDVVSFLSGLPRLVSRPGLVMAHGSLNDVEEYVHRDEHAAAQLAQLTVEHKDARILILGHTHRQLVYADQSGAIGSSDGDVLLPPRQRALLNPGSVGQSRQLEWVPRARCAVLDLGTSHVQLLEVDYDVRACRRALQRQGLLTWSIHPPGSPLRAGAHRVRRRLRRRFAHRSGRR